jgi:general transcription factor IIIA
MNSNPWNVGSIDEFSYFNCPECTFHAKEDKNFQDHAMRNHPLSSVLFSKGTKLITFSGKSDLNQLKQRASEQKCNELMSKYNLPEKLQVSMSKVDESGRILNNVSPIKNEQQLKRVTKKTRLLSHTLNKGFSVPLETDKHLRSSLKEGEPKNPKKNNTTFYPLKIISCKDQKSTPNMEKIKRNLSSTKTGPSIASTMTNSLENKGKLSESFVEVRATVNEIDPLAVENQENKSQSEITDYSDTLKDLNENFSDEEEVESGVINVKFSKLSPETVKLQKPKNNKKLIEKEVKSVAVGKVNAISILKKSEPNLSINLTESQENEFKQKSQTLSITEDMEFFDESKTKMSSFFDIETAELDPKFDEENKMWKCSICNKIVSSKKNLKNHLLKIHEVGKSQTCQECEKEFDDKRELKVHTITVHDGKKLYRCSICAAYLTDLKIMKRHLATVHEKEELLNCKPRELLEMNLFHVLEKPQTCSQCGENLVTKRMLKQHVLSVHEGKKLYRCSICKASLINIKHMKRHIVSVHEKNKNLLNCKPMEFLKMNLFHEMKKSQTCDQCGDKFSDKNDLKGHVLYVHDKKTLYQCSICTAYLTEVGKMKRHLITIHGKDNLLNCKPKQLIRMNLFHKIVQGLLN